MKWRQTTVESNKFATVIWSSDEALRKRWHGTFSNSDKQPRREATWHGSINKPMTYFINCSSTQLHQFKNRKSCKYNLVLVVIKAQFCCLWLLEDEGKQAICFSRPEVSMAQLLLGTALKIQRYQVQILLPATKLIFPSVVPRGDTRSIHDKGGGPRYFFGLKIYTLSIFGGSRDLSHIFFRS